MSVTINGSVGGTALTDASTLVAQKGVPAFSAYRSASQSISAGVFTKVAFNNEEFDTNSAYDSTTNYRFQPSVAGYYQVSSSLTLPRPTEEQLA